MNSPAHQSSWFFAWHHPRFWCTVLWALVIGVGVGAWYLAEQYLGRRAAQQTIFMTPTRDLTEAQRRQAIDDIRPVPTVAAAVWVSPEQLTFRVENQFADPQWAELIPKETAWLPWILEVRPRDPLDRLPAIAGWIGTLKQEGQWQVLWNGSQVAKLKNHRNALRTGGGFFLLFVLLTGMGALLTHDWPQSDRLNLYLWSTAGSVVAPALVWLVVVWAFRGTMQIGWAPPLLAVGSGFLLAGLIGPMLRHKSPRRTEITLSEAYDERTR